MSPAHTYLRRSDLVLAAVIDRIVLKRRPRETNHFRSLVRAIISQQISGKAAASILKRFIELAPKKEFPEPEIIVRMPIQKLRSIGLSRQKAAYLKDLSRNIANRRINFRAFADASDDEVISELTKVRGIGRWTAEMFLMFSLGRPDVFSCGDLGLQNAVKKLYWLRSHPTRKQLEKISSAWKPHRSLASRYLWASIENF
jgi:DNA-3-methyladenine glycosylase II